MVGLARWNGEWFVAVCRDDVPGVELRGANWPHLRAQGFAPPRPDVRFLFRRFFSPEGIEFFPEARLHGEVVFPQSFKLDTDERLVLVIWTGPGPPPNGDTWERHDRDAWSKYVRVEDLRLTPGPLPERAFAAATGDEGARAGE